MPYRIAGIDVHKKKLAVVVADVEVEEEYEFERRWYGSNPEQLQLLSEWLIAQQVEEVVMESTSQYWKPVWGVLERHWKAMCQRREGAGRMSGTLHLAQAFVQSWTARAEERFSRRRTSREAVGFPGADLELRARCRTASVADPHAQQVSTDACQSTSAESTGGIAGRSPYQVVQFGFGPARG